MKRIFAVAAALCLLAAPGAFAQKQQQNQNGRMPKERPTVEQMAQRRTERMTRELGLDQTQAKKVYAINLRQAQQMEAHRAQMLKERQTDAADMKSVLSAEQYDKWSQMQGSRPGAHRGKMNKDAKRGCCKQGKDCNGDKDGKNCCKQNKNCNGDKGARNAGK
ncbi:MAG: DUF4890 domain-containing protein [Alistipes sp.]|nr:DUF4890 domain-containing protein [Alistipes senegalensis]MCM1250439.1 DUF4890 domain-containing protein [Alistipes sp.]